MHILKRLTFKVTVFKLRSCLVFSNILADDVVKTFKMSAVCSDVNKDVSRVIDTVAGSETVKLHCTTVKEGKAEVLFSSSQDVFYNPVQEFNRDMSVAVIKQFLKRIPTMNKGLYRKLKQTMLNREEIGVKVLEALSASGLRAIRYAKEIEGLKNIVANDMSYQAYQSIQRNIKHNSVEHVVVPKNEEATLLMYMNKNEFDVIDLDPYGTPSPFLDSAVQSVRGGGLLMVTCTDMAVLCGNVIETCHAKYGAVSMKTPYCHEMALRIVLQCIESHANRYSRYIEPLISISADFYIRVFVQVFSGAAAVKKSIRKLSMVYVCQGCSSFHLHPLGTHHKTEKGEKYCNARLPVNAMCDTCGGYFKMGGPIWSANLHDKDFVYDVVDDIKDKLDAYNTSKRMLGMLNVILEELDDCPLYHKIDKLCSTVHTASPSLVQFRSALLHAGYRVSMSHAMPCTIKTDAPQHVVWDIIREWARQNAGKKTFELEPSKTIMSKVSSIEVSFEPRKDANPESRSNHLLRYQINPERYWGPKARAKSSLHAGAEEKKRRKYQGKRKKLSSDASNECVATLKKVKDEDTQKPDD